MKLRRVLFIYTLPFFILLISGAKGKDDAPYGPFKIGALEIKTCEKTMKVKGPCDYNFKAEKNKEDHFIIRTNLSFVAEIGPLMGKTQIFKWSNGNFVKILAMNQPNLCQFSFPLKVLPFTLITDKNCVAKAASYINEVLDVDKLASTLLGKKFFYGKIRLIFEWFSRKATAVCLDVMAELTASS